VTSLKKTVPDPLIQRTRLEKLLALPRSLLWYAGILPATAVFGTIGLLFALRLSTRRRYWFFSQWSFFLVWWARVTCGIKYTLEGRENIPDTPCIVMCKHQSAWETLALQYWFSPQTWVLKRELLKLPMIGWALRSLDPIAIDRTARSVATQQLIEQGAERLQTGRHVVVFPEGTRVPAGYPGRYHRGGVKLAHATGYPMVPVAHNAGELWPRNSFLKFPGTITVRIGAPILPADRDPEELLEVVKTWIEDNTRAISTVYVGKETGVYVPS